MTKQLGRRGFLQGMGALGVTLGLGSKVISREVSREVDSTILDGVERGLYDLETAKPFLSSTEVGEDATRRINEVIRREIRKETPKVVDVPDPIDALIRHDWSKELGDRLEKNFQVHLLPPGKTSYSWCEPVKVKIRSKHASEDYITEEMQSYSADLEHMYCSFIVSDEFMANAKTVNLRDLFFIPALESFKNFIEEEREGKRLAVQRMSLPVPGLGIKGHVSDGGPIPIRCTAKYDVLSAGVRFTLEVQAKVY